ncbi:hypothetical protein HSX11_16075 [Oxalobacteraceae bacterium]|nr:hypothetical protein [Oxalobacteraceae bacterium]
MSISTQLDDCFKFVVPASKCAAPTKPTGGAVREDCRYCASTVPGKVPGNLSGRIFTQQNNGSESFL